MKKILSIQSHVACGYVGNKVASFVIQRFGHEVVQINSLQFSNHTGYKNGFEGDAFSKEHLLSIFSGLKKNNLLNDVNHGITGYIGSRDSAEAIYEIILSLKKQNKNFIYFCDPVMGDNFTHCFVKPEVKDFLCQKLITLANVIKANHTEAQFLFNRDINSENDARDFYDFLVEKTENQNLILIITSFMRGKDIDNEKIKTLMVTRGQNFIVENHLLNLHPLTCGTGDLVTALFASCIANNIEEKKALNHTIKAIYNILEYGVKNNAIEMQLIAMQNEIEYK